MEYVQLLSGCREMKRIKFLCIDKNYVEIQYFLDLLFAFIFLL